MDELNTSPPTDFVLPCQSAQQVTYRVELSSKDYEHLITCPEITLHTKKDGSLEKLTITVTSLSRDTLTRIQKTPALMKAIGHAFAKDTRHWPTLNEQLLKNQQDPIQCVNMFMNFTGFTQEAHVLIGDEKPDDLQKLVFAMTHMQGNLLPKNLSVLENFLFAFTGMKKQIRKSAAFNVQYQMQPKLAYEMTSTPQPIETLNPLEPGNTSLYETVEGQVGGHVTITAYEDRIAVDHTQNIDYRFAAYLIRHAPSPPELQDTLNTIGNMYTIDESWLPILTLSKPCQERLADLVENAHLTQTMISPELIEWIQSNPSEKDFHYVSNLLLFRASPEIVTQALAESPTESHAIDHPLHHLADYGHDILFKLSKQTDMTNIPVSHNLLKWLSTPPSLTQQQYFCQLNNLNAPHDIIIDFLSNPEKKTRYAHLLDTHQHDASSDSLHRSTPPSWLQDPFTVQYRRDMQHQFSPSDHTLTTTHPFVRDIAALQHDLSPTKHSEPFKNYQYDLMNPDVFTWMNAQGILPHFLENTYHQDVIHFLNGLMEQPLKRIAIEKMFHDSLSFFTEKESQSWSASLLIELAQHPEKMPYAQVQMACLTQMPAIKTKIFQRILKHPILGKLSPCDQLRHATYLLHENDSPKLVQQTDAFLKKTSFDSTETNMLITLMSTMSEAALPQFMGAHHLMIDDKYAVFRQIMQTPSRDPKLTQTIYLFEQRKQAPDLYSTFHIKSPYVENPLWLYAFSQLKQCPPKQFALWRADRNLQTICQSESPENSQEALHMLIGLSYAALKQSSRETSAFFARIQNSKIPPIMLNPMHTTCFLQEAIFLHRAINYSHGLFSREGDLNMLMTQDVLTALHDAKINASDHPQVGEYLYEHQGDLHTCMTVMSSPILLNALAHDKQFTACIQSIITSPFIQKHYPPGLQNRHVQDILYPIIRDFPCHEVITFMQCLSDENKRLTPEDKKALFEHITPKNWRAFQTLNRLNRDRTVFKGIQGIHAALLTPTRLQQLSTFNATQLDLFEHHLKTSPSPIQQVFLNHPEFYLLEEKTRAKILTHEPPLPNIHTLIQHNPTIINQLIATTDNNEQITHLNNFLEKHDGSWEEQIADLSLLSLIQSNPPNLFQCSQEALGNILFTARTLQSDEEHSIPKRKIIRFIQESMHMLSENDLPPSNIEQLLQTLSQDKTYDTPSPSEALSMIHQGMHYYPKEASAILTNCPKIFDTVLILGYQSKQLQAFAQMDPERLKQITSQVDRFGMKKVVNYLTSKNHDFLVNAPIDPQSMAKDIEAFSQRGWFSLKGWLPKRAEAPMPKTISDMHETVSSTDLSETSPSTSPEISQDAMSDEASPEKTSTPKSKM